METRRKLYGKKTVEKVERTRTDRETRLEEELSAAKEEKRRMKDKISLLEWKVSDYEARFLSQASEICALQGIEKTKIVRKCAVGDIINKVLESYPGITFEDIISVRRTKCLIEPRHMAMTAVYEARPDLSFPTIGKIFGNRDHSSVMYAVRKTQALRDSK